MTDFTTPDPLDHFFRKTALAVETSQIVDLIIPEFSLLRSAAAFGGDADNRLNPFKRITEKPVVFWSRVIDADETERELVYDVPVIFFTERYVMAVAIHRRCLGIKNSLFATVYHHADVRLWRRRAIVSRSASPWRTT